MKNKDNKMTLDHRSCLFWYLIKFILISSKKYFRIREIIASTGKKVSKKHPEYYYSH